jgi:hypothetical protein
MTATGLLDGLPVARTARSAPEWWELDLPVDSPGELAGVPTAGFGIGADTGEVKKSSGIAGTALSLSGAKNRHPNLMLEVADLITQLQQLQREGKPYAAGDLVFDFFEKRFEQGGQELQVCDSVLESLRPDRLSDTVLVAILAVTLPARDKLPSRPAFLRQVRDRLTIIHGPEEADIIAQAYK